jgi:hypothetical protein
MRGLKMGEWCVTVMSWARGRGLGQRGVPGAGGVGGGRGLVYVRRARRRASAGGGGRVEAGQYTGNLLTWAAWLVGDGGRRGICLAGEAE